MNDQLSNSNDTNLVLDKQPLVVAFYARVSTAGQEKEETIDSQVEEIEERILNDGNELTYRFADDGWSGESLARPQLDDLRDAAKLNQFKILYVYDLGRLSRDFKNQLILLDEFKDLGIDVISLHDINALNDEQAFARNVMGLFHDYERKKIAERMRRGKLFKAKSGVLINANSLYGYNYIKKTENTPAGYKVNKEQAQVVSEIFDWVGNERISLREVIRRLYDRGIPPRKAKSEFWTKGPVVRLLRCESYVTGVVHYNKSESVVGKRRNKDEKYNKVKKNSRRMRPRVEWHPFEVTSILNDRYLFDKVQNILDTNQKYAPKNRKHDYLLTSLVFCGCGNRRAGDGQNKYGHFYYRCAERLYNLPSDERKCRIAGVNAVVLDGMVWIELMKFIKDPELLKRKIEDVLKERKEMTANLQEYERLNTSVSKIEEEEQRYAKAYGVDALDFDQFRELMKEAKKKKQLLYGRLEHLKAESVETGLDNIQVDDICTEAKRVLDGIDYTDKSRSFKMLLDKVTIKEGGAVEVCGHLPLFTQKLGDELKSRNRRSSKRRKVNIV